jgi:hypothetical protein
MPICRHSPEFVLVSAGFDCDIRELGGLVTPAGIATMARACAGLADSALAADRRRSRAALPGAIVDGVALIGALRGGKPRPAHGRRPPRRSGARSRASAQSPTGASNWASENAADAGRFGFR